MKKVAALIILYMLSISSIANDESAKTFIGKFTGKITVTADGQVSNVALTNFGSAAMREFLTNYIKNWQLKPLKVNGNPVTASAPFSFDMFLVQKAGSNKFTQAYIRDINIEPTDIELKIMELEGKQLPADDIPFKPVYPFEALRAGAQADVEIVIKINSDGSVDNVGLSSISLIGVGFKRNDIQISYLKKYFTQSAILAAKVWRPSKAKLQQHDCMNGCISKLRISYTMGVETWKTYLELPVPKAAWLVDEVIKSDISKTTSQLVEFKEQPNNQTVEIGG